MANAQVQKLVDRVRIEHGSLRNVLVDTAVPPVMKRRTSFEKFQLEETCESDNPCRGGHPLGRPPEFCRHGSFAWDESDTTVGRSWSYPPRPFALKVHAVKRGEEKANR